jgi:hypothetical protein
MEEMINNDVIIFKDPITNIIAVYWGADDRFTIDEIAKRVTPEGIKYKILKELDLPTTDIFQETWDYDFENSFDGIGINEDEWKEVADSVLSNIQTMII